MKRVFIFSVVILFLAVACGGEGNTTPTQSVSSMTLEEIIAKGSAQLDALTSFHFKLDQKGGGTPIAMDLNMTGASGDIEPPDKLNMKIEAMWAGQFVDAGLVTVGETTYMTNPLNKKWEPLPDAFTAVKLFNPDSGIKAMLQGLGNPVKLEEEKVGGELCFHIKGTLMSEDLDSIACGHAIEGNTVGAEVWIGTQDFLLRKIRLEGQVTKEEKTGIVRTIELSHFDEPVTIELPK